MIVLTSTEKLQLVLSAGTADVDVNYNDRTTTAYGPADSQQTAATATTNDICAAPAASTSREINGLTATYKTTGGNVTLQKFNSSGSVTTKLWFGTLLVNENICYTHGGGLKVLDANGNIKESMPGYLPLTGGTLTGALIPSQTIGITGTTTNNNANTGAVGEYITSAVGPTNFPSTGTIGDLTSINLTAGDWDVSAAIQAQYGGATITKVIVGVSSTSGNSFTGLVIGDTRLEFDVPSVANSTSTSIPAARFSLSGSATIYLKYYSDYTVSTPTAYGRISARRVR